MKILISNDDGVFAPGLRALVNALSPLGQVTVVAPELDTSGSSSALTLDRPLTPRQIEPHVWAVNGTPADCVFLALNGLFSEPFDLVVAGINRGENIADYVLYSGTVGAAFEGRHLPYTPIAVSLAGVNAKKHTHLDAYEQAATWVYHFIRAGMPKLPANHVFNINIPDLPPAQPLQGQRYTRLGLRGQSYPIVSDANPRGKQVYWVGLSGEVLTDEDTQIQQHVTDFAAVSAGFVSITPLQLDATSYAALALCR